MLELLIAVILIFWLLGWAVFHIGDLIHFLLLVAVILVVVRLARGEKAV